jgi:hypothetical protein
MKSLFSFFHAVFNKAFSGVDILQAECQGIHVSCGDIMNTNMHQQIAYSQNATKPVQNTADDHKCALVCD